jgi:hypothetical protein
MKIFKRFVRKWVHEQGFMDKGHIVVEYFFLMSKFQIHVDVTIIWVGEDGEE